MLHSKVKVYQAAVRKDVFVLSLESIFLKCLEQTPSPGCPVSVKGFLTRPAHSLGTRLPAPLLSASQAQEVTESCCSGFDAPLPPWSPFL